MLNLEITPYMYPCDTGSGGCGKITDLRLVPVWVPCCSAKCAERMDRTINEEIEDI